MYLLDMVKWGHRGICFRTFNLDRRFSTFAAVLDTTRLSFVDAGKIGPLA